MLTAQQVRPATVGVSSGTTTFAISTGTSMVPDQLGDSEMCDRGARAATQRAQFLPTLFRALAAKAEDAIVTVAPSIAPVLVSTKVPAPTGTTMTRNVPVSTNVPGYAPTTVTRNAPVSTNVPAPARVAYSPYATFEQLKGVRGFFARLRGRRPGTWHGAVNGLGYVLNVGPTSGGQPTSEIVATMKSYGPDAYCGTYDKSYHTRGTPGLYYDTPLGAIPSDLQLSRIRGYTPVMSSWVPFQGRTWAPAPWVPPHGAWTPEGIHSVGPPISRLQLGAAGPTDAQSDPASMALFELRRQQDRTFALTVVSTMAIASTAVINVLKHLEDSHKRKKRDLEPGAPIAPMSGASLGRSRKRTRRGRR